MIQGHFKPSFWGVIYIISVLSMASYSCMIMYNLMYGMQISENVATLKYTKVFFPLFLFVILFSFKVLRGKDQIGKSLLVLGIYCASTTIFNAFIKGNSNDYIIAKLGLILLPIIVYYTFAIFLRRLNFYLIEFMLAVMVILMVFTYSIINNYINVEKELGMSLNVAYLPMICMCTLLFVKNRYFRILCIVSLVVLLLLSGKRTGLIGIGLGTLIISFKPLSKTKINKTSIVLLILISIFLIYTYVPDIKLLGERTITRFANNGSADLSSGRIDIYMVTFNMFLDSDFYNMLIGHGFDTVIMNSPFQRSAHSDFIEILYDFGLIGLALYIKLHISLIKRFVYLYKIGSNQYYPSVLSYSVFLSLSLFSHLYIYPYFFLMTMVFAFISTSSINYLDKFR